MATYVRLFGAPAVEHDGRTIALRPERRHQLAAWLALRGVPVARDQLAALFWPERDNASARRNLRRLAFDVEGFDWTPGLAGDRATLGWPVATDVADFERALAEARLDEALRLYRGPLCEGLEDANNNAFAEALCFERGRLAERWRAAVLAALEQAADASQRLALAHKLLAADGLDEEALAAALAAHAALGRTGQAQRLFREFKERLAEALGIEPSARLRELARGLDAGDAAQVAPAAAAGFVGRAAELAELHALLGRDECRLLTITGPGGIGKSRLAKAAIAALEARFADGIGWIPLDDLTDAAQVAPRIAQLLGIDVSGRASAFDAVAACLAPRQMLLVLDNSEQIAGLAALSERLLASAPRLKLLATSRHRLKAAGEWLLPLAPLPVPPPDASGAAIAEFDAVRLFALRARAVQPAFAAAREAESVARLVRALGGLPLAIELAAPWVRLLPVAEIEAEVANSLDLLERDEEGDERPEHRSVRATFEQSWRWLSPVEQQALAALAVFVGSFSRAAAQAVTGAPMAVLAALVDKSLVQARADGRFELHPLIQQFAREKMRALGLEVRSVERHTEWYTRLLGQLSERCEGGEPDALDQIECEFENCRSAWSAALAGDQPALVATMATPLWRFCETRGRWHDGVALFSAALTRLNESTPAHCAALAYASRSLAGMHYRNGEPAQAETHARRALRLYRRSRQPREVRRSLQILALALWVRGQAVEAQRYFDHALRLAEAAHDVIGMLNALNGIALCERTRGRYESAAQVYRRTLDLCMRAGDQQAQAVTRLNHGVLLRMQRDYEGARRELTAALALIDEQGLVTMRPFCLSQLGYAALASGEVDAATAWFEEALQTDRATGGGQIAAEIRLGLGRASTLRGDFAAARRWLREGLDGSLRVGDVPMQQMALLFAGAYFAACGDVPRATALWRHVIANPLAEKADREDARQMLEALACGPTASFAAAQATRLDACEVLQALDAVPVLKPGSVA
jgi:predicted ATPase/DNA-binding SARP family transcriptional activator/Tfp pilus assembly protein PilF